MHDPGSVTWQEFQKLWPSQNLLTSVLLFCCWSANFEASDLDEECSGCGSKKVPGEVGTWKQLRPGFMTTYPLGFGLLVQMPCSFWNQMLTSNKWKSYENSLGRGVIVVSLQHFITPALDLMPCLPSRWRIWLIWFLKKFCFIAAIVYSHLELNELLLTLPVSTGIQGLATMTAIQLTWNHSNFKPWTVRLTLGLCFNCLLCSK